MIRSFHYAASVVFAYVLLSAGALLLALTIHLWLNPSGA